MHIACLSECMHLALDTMGGIDMALHRLRLQEKKDNQEVSQATSTFLQVRLHTLLCMVTCTYIHTNVYILYICVYIYIYIYIIYIYIYIYIYVHYTCVFVCVLGLEMRAILETLAVCVLLATFSCAARR
jgi:hypothetical protein